MESQESSRLDRLEGKTPSSTADTVTPGSSLATHVKSDLKGDVLLDGKDTADKKCKKKCCKKQKKKKKKKKTGKKNTIIKDSSTDSDSDDSASDGSASDETDSSQEDEPPKRQSRKQREINSSKKAAGSSSKNSKKARARSPDSGFSAAESGAGDVSSSDDDKVGGGASQALTTSQMQAVTAAVSQALALQSRSVPATFLTTPSYGSFLPGQTLCSLPVPGNGETPGIPPPTNKAQAAIPESNLADGAGKNKTRKKKKAIKEPVSPDRLEYKRVDQVWDSTIHNFKLQSTAEADSDAQYDAYVLQIRRIFDFEGKYKSTTVDVKSKLLRECLQDVIGNIKGVSLVDNTPRLDPNILFLYLDDLREYGQKLKKSESVGASKRARQRDQKHKEAKRRHLKVLLAYLDKDYAQVKKSLYPMLENGLITFDLLWALWKPNTLVYTTTYGCEDEPRVFKAEAAEKHSSFVKGDFYYIEGKYVEFDGKQFGHGGFTEEIPEFRGARKITSLVCFPLQYHQNEEKVRETLVERGKKFVQLGGVHYKAHEGMAFFKKKKSIIKININGRVMVDGAIHRRCNPNYPVPLVRIKDHDLVSESEDSDEDEDSESGCGCGDDSDTEHRADDRGDGSESDDKMVKKVYRDEKGDLHVMHFSKNVLEEQAVVHRLGVERLGGSAEDGATDGQEPEFSDEEFLLASPVVLGFSFAEKMWLEFTVSGIKEIQWNEKAYDSLVLQEKPKAIVRALVESHKHHGTESIDDVIQGKGKGLVAVLHGPPGTGKTLTAEGISELLKCPLYMASAGELGTDSRFLETELQKILDICHAWGAILLLDEADVFLEKRNMHDIQRNALVSIFLRQLEYFQGILFLTTNRVETFDEAFQSRIHVALRYDKLSVKARRAVFEIFIERARAIGKGGISEFTEEDYDHLTKFDLNGRQIKNTIRTAQALATNKQEPLNMGHIKDVLEVQRSFEQDLKGGTGYEEAMRAYQ